MDILFRSYESALHLAVNEWSSCDISEIFSIFLQSLTWVYLHDFKITGCRNANFIFLKTFALSDANATAPFGFVQF